MGPSDAASRVLQQVPMKMSMSSHSEKGVTALCPIPRCGHQPHSHRSHGPDSQTCLVALVRWESAAGAGRDEGSGVGEDPQLMD